MPSLSEMMKSTNNMEKYTPVEHTSPVITSAPISTPEPILRDPHLRCPVPPIGVVSPDSIRQFYLSGRVPQYRVFLG